MWRQALPLRVGQLAFQAKSQGLNPYNYTTLLTTSKNPCGSYEVQ